MRKLLDLLSDDEKAVVNKRDPMEISITPKLLAMNPQIKSLVAYGALDALDPHREMLRKKKHTLDELCQMAFDKAIYNASFLACGLGHKHNHLISSKIFAKMMWRGDYFRKGYPQSALNLPTTP